MSRRINKYQVGLRILRGRAPRKLKKVWKKALFGFQSINWHGIYKRQKRWDSIMHSVMWNSRRGKALIRHDSQWEYVEVISK